MFIQNCFYNNPELHRLVTKRRQHVYVIRTCYGGDFHYKATCVGWYRIGDDGFPKARNAEPCINDWVHHCILVHMLDNPTAKQIDTKDCFLTRDDMRKIIMFGEPRTEYKIRSLKYVDDMIDVVEFLLEVRKY